MWIVCALSAGAARAETPPVRWVRFEEADLERRLETAQVAFVHTAARAELTLIGMLHVAEPAYYEALRPELARFEAVFYEGIRGSLPELDRSIANYERLGRLFGLSRQADLLPARGPNFVHADLSVDELRQTMGARALEDDLRPGPEAAGLERLLADLASRPRNDHVKEELARRLGRAADEPHEHVLVRNARCWEVARAEVARRGGAGSRSCTGPGTCPTWPVAWRRPAIARSRSAGAPPGGWRRSTACRTSWRPWSRRRSERARVPPGATGWSRGWGRSWWSHGSCNADGADAAIGARRTA